MRLSSGGCYEITGTVVRPVADAPSVAGTPARRGERRADLWAESLAIAQMNHTLTAEENGLFNAIQKEIKTLDADVPPGETASHQSIPSPGSSPEPSVALRSVTP